MPSLAIVLSAALYMLLTLVPTQRNDIKVVIRQSFGGNHTYTTTEYFSGMRSRREYHNSLGDTAGPLMAMIVQRGPSTHKVFTLDLDAHEYTSYETDTHGAPLGARTTAIPSQFTGGKLDIFIESTDTGERRTMFGHVAKHIITHERRVPEAGSCSSSSESEVDGWYIDYAIMPEWLRPVNKQVAVVVSSARGCFDKIEVHGAGVDLGYPLKLTTTLHSAAGPDAGPVLTAKNGLEVVEFHEGPLDPSLFEVPEGFRPVERLHDMPGHHATAWERFKNWVTTMFE